MSLASKLRSQFNYSVQFRGERIFNSRLPRGSGYGPDHLRGTVMGGSPYEISMRHDENRLLVFCECAYFMEHGECKHLWAAVLEADRLGALRGANDANYL